MALDDLRTEAESASETSSNDTVKKIKMKINGSSVETMVDVSSLQDRTTTVLSTEFGICHGHA